MAAAGRTENTRHLLPRYVDRAATMRHEQARVVAEAILETGHRLPSADDQSVRHA